MPDNPTTNAWTKITLAECCEEIAQRVDNPAASGYERFVGLEHLETGETTIRSWGNTEDVASSMKLFKTGDVIVARRNVYLRRAARAGFDGVCSGDGIVLRGSPGVCLPELLPFLLNTYVFWDYVTSQADGTMSKRITVKRLLSYEFALPPLEEQRRIAGALTKSSALVDSLKKLVEAASIAQASAALEAFSSVEGSAATVRLKDICRNGPQSGIYKSEEYRGIGTPMVNMGELFGNDIVDDSIQMQKIDVDEEELQRFSLTPNDLLFGRRSVVLEGAGRCVLVGNLEQPAVFESSVLRATVDPREADSRFVFEWLRSPKGHQQIRKIVTFTTVSGVAGSDVARLKIPLPSLRLQKQIADKLLTLRKAAVAPRARALCSEQFSRSLANHLLEAP